MPPSTVERPALHRVALHVGAPKSGTTFLQNALWANREELDLAGFRCPGERQREMFIAAIDVRGTARRWGMRPEEVDGTWRRLAEEAKRYAGTSIMSHELLAPADTDQATAALRWLDGVDVRLVFTARDLGRQVVSEWQERVKNGSTASFEEFQARVRRRLERGDRGGGFWSFQDLPGVLDRWGATLPPANIHVVVAPPPGADPDELWRRFGDAVGFDAASLEPSAGVVGANRTLGVAQIAILREVNAALDGRIPQPAYAHVVKRFLAQDLLARHTSPRPVCPPGLAALLRAETERWITEIGARGYQVHGDLAELLPDEALDAAADAAVGDPDEVDPVTRAAISDAVLADLLVEVSQLRTRVRRLSGTAEPGAPESAPSLRARVRARARRLVESLRRRG